MNLIIIILTIFGIIFSRDIYFFVKRFFKLVDERLFFLANLIKKGFNFINDFLSNIFDNLDKKFKFKKFYLSLGLFFEKLFEKFWNLDKDLREKSLSLTTAFLYLIFLLIRGSFSLFILGIATLVSLSPIIFLVYLINNFTPKPIASLFAYVQYAILNTFGSNLFSILIIFIVFGASFLIISSVIGLLFNRYFGTKKKTKKKKWNYYYSDHYFSYYL